MECMCQLCLRDCVFTLGRQQEPSKHRVYIVWCRFLRQYKKVLLLASDILQLLNIFRCCHVKSSWCLSWHVI
jgi:hypothetical protein